MTRSLLTVLSILVSATAFADEGGHSGNTGLIAIGAGLAIGIAAIGGALGQGKTAAAALDGIARNPAAQPKIFTPWILSLVFIETMAIYAFVIAIILVTTKM